jgi:hypothetical protein
MRDGTISIIYILFFSLLWDCLRFPMREEEVGKVGEARLMMTYLFGCFAVIMYIIYSILNVMWGRGDKGGATVHA